MVQIDYNGDELVEVDYAFIYQQAISKSNLLHFKSKKLRKIIQGCEPTQVIIVTSVIGGPKKIINVEILNKEFIEKEMTCILVK